VLPRAVACDLDGTLLRSDGTLDARSRRALVEIERSGIQLVLCTARPHRWLRPLGELIGHQGVAICANGAVVCDLRTESILEARPLAPPVARDVVGRLKAELPGSSWAVERTTGFAHEPRYTPRWPVPPDTIVDVIEALITEPAVKLMVRDDRLGADPLLALARRLVGGRAELTHSNSADSLLEISAPGVSKASALERLCRQRGIEPEEVIAFGDMPNDLPMLRWAGHGVAVANAHPDVLEAADEVTLDNDDAGVARVLERLTRPPRRRTAQGR
jgi:hydroxymethylpyrimidine pyrophosphatase-like HAD family hydrolase